MSTLLRSSGIDSSHDRIPDSTCASGRSSRAHESAPASVVFVSPYTSTRSGRTSSITGSSACIMPVTCSPALPEPMPSWRSGAGSPSSRKNTADNSSS